MELTWLEDFLALAQHLNFSRAAEARNVTQPAFSRRIRGLEAWLGADVVQRLPTGVVLSAAGESLRDDAARLMRDIHRMRREALEAAGRQGRALSIAATHVLSFTFFPGWIRARAPLDALGTLNLASDSMAACERSLLAGEVDMLLCHYHEAAPPPFPENAFTSVVVGADLLVPVCAAGAPGQPLWPLSGGDGAPVRFLAYSAPSGLGRILAARWRTAPPRPVVETVFTSPLAAALLTMARQGQGVAWMPQTLAAEDLATGRLVDAGDGRFSIPIEIRLFRPRHRRSPTAEAFWKAVAA